MNQYPAYSSSMDSFPIITTSSPPSSTWISSPIPFPPSLSSTSLSVPDPPLPSTTCDWDSKSGISIVTCSESEDPSKKWTHESSKCLDHKLQRLSSQLQGLNGGQ